MSALPSAINYQEGLAVLPENTQNFNISCVLVSGGSFGPSSQIQVDLGNRGFLDPASLLIRYKIQYTSTAGATGTQIVGTPVYIPFLRFETLVNSNTVETNLSTLCQTTNYIKIKTILLKIIRKTKKSNWNIIYFCEAKDNVPVKQRMRKIKKNFPSLTFYKAEDNMTDWEQLLLMSCSDHNIIANSAFSWWAAYLNTNSDKIVCYPSVWFGQVANNDTRDLCPPNWVRVTV